MSDRKRSSGGGRPLSFCYYHRRYEDEARKCSQGEPCEFKNLKKDNGQKQVLDLRNKLRPDLRNSLEEDLRDHLNKNKQGAKATAKRPKNEDLRSKLSRPRANYEEEAQSNEINGARSKRRPKPCDTQGSYYEEKPKQKGLKKSLSHPKTAKTPWEEKSDLFQSREEVEEEGRDLFEEEEKDLFQRKSNSTPEEDKYLVHISQIQEEEDDESDHLEASVPTRTVVNDSKSIPRKIYINPKFPGNSRRFKIDPTDEAYEELNKEDRSDDKRNTHHSKKNPNNQRGSRSDPNSRKGTRYDPKDRQTSGSSSNNDPVYPRRKGYDRYSDSDDDPTTPRRRRRRSRHNRSEDNSDSDSDDIRPAYDLDTPREGRQKQRDKGWTAKSGSSSYEEIIQYNFKQHLAGLEDEKPGEDRSGMPINKENRNQCPVPLCEAGNRAVINYKGRYEDTDVSHRFLSHCPIVRAMNVKERWSFYDKNDCTCTGCFSTTHNFQSCPLQLNYKKLCNAKEEDGRECQGAHHWLLHVDSHI